MPKASPLDIDLTANMQQPPAATAPRRVKEQGREAAPPKEATAQVNCRWPKAEVKAMKREALEADMTVQDYLLACFQAYSQHSKTVSR